MRAGQLKDRVQFIRRNRTGHNSSGPVYGAPTDLGTFYARVWYLDGKEKEEAQQRWAEARFGILIRRQPGVTLQAEDTAVWKGRTLDILEILGPDTADDHWTMKAKDHVA